MCIYKNKWIQWKKKKSACINLSFHPPPYLLVFLQLIHLLSYLASDTGDPLSSCCPSGPAIWSAPRLPFPVYTFCYFNSRRLGASEPRPSRLFGRRRRSLLLFLSSLLLPLAVSLPTQLSIHSEWRDTVYISLCRGQICCKVKEINVSPGKIHGSPVYSLGAFTAITSAGQV